MIISERLSGEELKGSKGSEHVFLVEDGAIPPAILETIREDLEGNVPGFDWVTFSDLAVERWKAYIPSGEMETVVAPNSEFLAGLQWSELVPKDLSDGEKLASRVSRAWEIWKESIERGYALYPHVAVDGAMGSGKTNLAEALLGKRPWDAKLYPECWQDNLNLPLFYDQLKVFFRSANRLSDEFESVVRLFHRIQGRTQAWFAARTFIEYAISASDLRESFILQDTSNGQNAVYMKAHQLMGVASDESVSNYDNDNDLRRQLLPPPLLNSIHVFAFVPLEEMLTRIKESRQRRIEMGIPDEYYVALYANSTQRMIAAAEQASIIIVDANIDFRPGSPERDVIAGETWQAVDVIKAKQDELLLR